MPQLKRNPEFVVLQEATLRGTTFTTRKPPLRPQSRSKA